MEINGMVRFCNNKYSNFNFKLFLDVYFVPVVAYLIFSCGDYVGRLLAGSLQWVIEFYINSEFMTR